MKKIKYIFIISTLFVVSCIKEIKIKTDTIEKLPVVNCIFNPDSVFKVYLSFPVEIINNKPSYIEDANIKITGSNNTSFNLYYTGKNGIYKTSEKPEIEVLYKLEVNVPGYKTVTANDKIPESALIDNVEYYYDIDPLNETDTIYYANVTFSDNKNKKNYYDFINFYYNNKKKEYLLHYWLPPKFVIDPVLIAEGNSNYYPTSDFFSDVLINGQKYTLTIFGYPSYDIEFRTTSKNYYLFRKFWTRHFYNQNNDQNIGNDFEDIDFTELLFSGEPIEMFTNIENGYGIFAGYSCDVWFSETSKSNF